MEIESHEVYLIIGIIDGKADLSNRHTAHKVASLRKRLMKACIAKAALIKDNVASGYYSQSDETACEFDVDAEVYIINSGVPKDKGAKLFSKAYEDGHSSGRAEVMHQIDSLIDLFK